MEVPAKFKSALVGLRYSLLAFLIVATSAFLVSCGNTSSTKVTKGPDNLTITLSSDTTHPGEEVTVLVTVIDDNGDPIEGLTVEFSLPQNTSQAFLSALSGITDFNGQTTITYTAGPTSGGNDVLNAHIIIRSNGIKLELDANATIAVDPTLIGSLTISTGATSIVADGTSNTAVRATLVDVNGAAVVGEPVTFTTTLGTIIGSPATTNIDGIAQVTLRAGTITGTALVNGNAAGFSNNLQVQFLAGSPDEISITASPSTIAPLDTSTVIVTVLDGSDNPVANETIIFSIDDNESGGSFASLTAITNINGQAVVDYTAGAVEGTDDIRARAASNGIFDTEDILVETTTGAVVVGSLTLTSGSASLRANNIDFTTLRATVLDTGGQPVQNREVFFSSTLGTINGSPALTNSNGIAQVTLKAGYIAGIATAYAQTGGFNAQVDIPFTTGAPFLVDMTPTPSTISPLGTSTVFVTVEDSAGNRIPGETVIFSVEDNNTGGSFPVLTAVTDINGMAIVDYIGGGIAGTDEIRVRTASNGKDDTAFVTVDLSAAVIQSVTISAGDTELIADGTSQITVRALVLGVNNLPAVGVEVVFSSTLGTFPFGDSEFTDADGRAEVLLRSGTDVGIATVMASTGGFNDTIDIPFVADESNTLTITATPTTVIPLGTTSVAVELLDSFGSPVEGETIIFSIPTNESGGSFSELTAVTDINGMAVVQYTSGAAGIAPILDTIRARSATDADVDDTQVITIDDTSTALAGSLTLEVNDTILRADGEGNTAPGLPDRTQLKATLLDTNGDPVPATEIIFTTTLGTFSGASPYDTDPNGLATLELIAGETVGTAVVNAYFGGFNAQVEVQFVAGPPAGLTILATPTTISPLGTTSVLVTVVDGATTPNPVEGETIIFSIPTNASGGSFDSLTAVTDVNGMAVVQYTAGSNDDVWDNIAARTQSDAGVNDDEDILVSPAAGTNVKSLTLTSAEDTLIADGVVTPPFKSLLRATLLDLDDNPISGATIIFTTTLGDFATTPAAPYITDVNGVASIELEADSTLGIATVNVYYGGFNDQVQVNFVAGPADDITIVSPSGAPATAVPLSTQPVLVLVEDAADNPLEGETVLFSFVDNFSGASFSALSAGGSYWYWNSHSPRFYNLDL